LREPLMEPSIFVPFKMPPMWQVVWVASSP
jgi:hypothetical protein